MEEKRMVDTYEIVSSIHINGKEIVFGIDDNKDYPYFVSSGKDTFLGKAYDEAYIFNNYIEALEHFTQKLSEEITVVKTADKLCGITDLLSEKDCIENSQYEDYTDEVLVIDPKCLQRDKRSARYQLVLAFGGFGCNKNSNGRAVLVKNIYSGESMRYDRQDVLGVISPEKMPEWAKEKLRHISEKQKNRQQPER